jgi:hypothetical protein
MDNKLKQFYNEHSRREHGFSDEASKRVKEQIFARLGNAIAEEPVISSWEKFYSLFSKSFVIAPLAFVLFIGGTAIASADALPGDRLYVVKRQLENVRLFVAPTQEAKLQIREDLAQKRIEEMELNLKAQEAVSKDTVDPSEEVKPNNTEAGNQEESKSVKRAEQAKQEAAKAIQKLNDTKKNWEKRGDQNKAKEIDEKVETLKKRLEDRSKGSNSGTERLQITF